MPTSTASTSTSTSESSTTEMPNPNMADVRARVVDLLGGIEEVYTRFVNRGRTMEANQMREFGRKLERMGSRGGVNQFALQNMLQEGQNHLRSAGLLAESSKEAQKIGQLQGVLKDLASIDSATFTQAFSKSQAEREAERFDRLNPVPRFAKGSSGRGSFTSKPSSLKKDKFDPDKFFPSMSEHKKRFDNMRNTGGRPATVPAPLGPGRGSPLSPLSARFMGFGNEPPVGFPGSRTSTQIRPGRTYGPNVTDPPLSSGRSRFGATAGRSPVRSFQGHPEPGSLIRESAKPGSQFIQFGNTSGFMSPSGMAARRRRFF